MIKNPLRGCSAIAGIGYTEQGKIANRTALSFHTEACANAIKDAGIKKDDIDGLFIYRHFNTRSNEPDITPYLVAQQLGIKPDYLSEEANCARSHLYNAVSLLYSGLCKYILISYADNALLSKRTFVDEATHGEPFGDVAAFGQFGLVSAYAMAARRAMFENGTGPNVWKHIAMSTRAWANLNPRAIMHRKVMSEDDYFNSKYIVEPLRLFDCALINDGGRACVITTTERAKDLKNSPAVILGIGQSNPSYDIHQSFYMTKNSGAKRASELAMHMAKVTHKDIDALQIYDCFTYTVDLTLSDYGFYDYGHGEEFFNDKKTYPGGRLPMNTSGGLLSEAYFMGLTQLTEGAIQLMGRAEERQLGVLNGTKKPNIVLCSDNGAALQTHNCTILGSIDTL
jgi:acetyl-CoA acetyltransferase